MKKSIVWGIGLTLLVLGLSGCMTMQAIKEEDKVFSQIYDAPGFTRDVLYEKTKIWIAETFRSAKAVMEYDNAKSGTLIGNGAIPFPCKDTSFYCTLRRNWTVPFTMKMEAQDNKFRLTFSNLRLAWPETYGGLIYTGHQPAGDMPLVQQEYYNMVRPALLGLGEEIKMSLKKTVDSGKW